MRADLAERGVDLAAWWQERRWKPLLELIDALPAACRTRAAVMNDPEFAELLADARDEQDEPGEWAPPAAEFGLTEGLTLAVVNELRALRRDLGALATGKARDVEMLSGPRTLVDELVERRNREQVLDILALLSPHVDLSAFRA